MNFEIPAVDNLYIHNTDYSPYQKCMSTLSDLLQNQTTNFPTTGLLICVYILQPASCCHFNSFVDNIMQLLEYLFSCPKRYSAGNLLLYWCYTTSPYSSYYYYYYYSNVDGKKKGNIVLKWQKFIFFTFTAMIHDMIAALTTHNPFLATSLLPIIMLLRHSDLAYIIILQ